MTRADILAVLEHHSGIVDDAAEREILASALHDAMLANVDAVRVRESLRISSDGDLYVMTTFWLANARHQEDLLKAAARLAGGT